MKGAILLVGLAERREIFPVNPRTGERREWPECHEPERSVAAGSG